MISCVSSFRKSDFTPSPRSGEIVSLASPMPLQRIKTATRIPMIPSTFHPVACSTSAAIRTAVVVSTSFLLSAAVASRVVESIFFPIRVLKIIIPAFTRIDAIRTIIESRENSTATG